MAPAKDVLGDLFMLGRGKVDFNQLLAGVYQGERFLGNAPAFGASISDNRKIKRSSATAAAPIVKDALISRDFTFTLELDEWSVENRAIGLMGELSVLAQGAVTAGTLAIVGDGTVKQGYWYQVVDVDGKHIRKLTSLTITGGTLVTDYLVDAEGGRIFIVPGGGIADGDTLAGSYNAAADTSRVINAASLSKVEGFLRFTGDPASGIIYEAKLWKVSIQPDGDQGWIADDFGVIKLKITVYDDSANHPDFPLGQVIERTLPEGTGIAPFAP